MSRNQFTLSSSDHSRPWSGSSFTTLTYDCTPSCSLSRKCPQRYLTIWEKIIGGYRHRPTMSDDIRRSQQQPLCRASGCTEQVKAILTTRTWSLDGRVRMYRSQHLRNFVFVAALLALTTNISDYAVRGQCRKDILLTTRKDSVAKSCQRIYLAAWTPRSIGYLARSRNLWRRACDPDYEASAPRVCQFYRQGSTAMVAIYIKNNFISMSCRRIEGHRDTWTFIHPYRHVSNNRRQGYPSFSAVEMWPFEKEVQVFKGETKE